VVAGYVAISATGPDGVIVQRATGSKTIADDRNFKAGTPACAAACTHKKVAGVPTRFRYGRLSLGNAYGSELLDLPIPLQAQYWAAAGYYVTNRDDVCTAINPSSIKLAGFSQNLAACETQFSPTGLQTLVGGKLPLRMTRPGAGNNGGVGLELNIGSVAAGTTCVAAASSPATAASLPWFGIVNPAARASFGAFKTPLIYRREVY
jgi:MSHA biogenesis protein MshQ